MQRFIPWCQADGSYSPLQCYQSYCYCVDRDGKEIVNTRTYAKTGQPKCTHSSEFIVFLLELLLFFKTISLVSVSLEHFNCKTFEGVKCHQNLPLIRCWMIFIVLHTCRWIS